MNTSPSEGSDSKELEELIDKLWKIYEPYPNYFNKAQELVTSYTNRKVIEARKEWEKEREQAN
jgi:hypothetical protein